MNNGRKHLGLYWRVKNDLGLSFLAAHLQAPTGDFLPQNN